MKFKPFGIELLKFYLDKDNIVWESTFGLLAAYLLSLSKKNLYFVEIHKLIKFSKSSNFMVHLLQKNGKTYVIFAIILEKLPDFKPTFPKFKGVDPSTYFKNFDSVSLDLLMKLIALDPIRRISMKEALKHPYFKDIS